MYLSNTYFNIYEVAKLNFMYIHTYISYISTQSTKWNHCMYVYIYVHVCIYAYTYKYIYIYLSYIFIFNSYVFKFNSPFL